MSDQLVDPIPQSRRRRSGGSQALFNPGGFLPSLLLSLADMCRASGSVVVHRSGCPIAGRGADHGHWGHGQHAVS